MAFKETIEKIRSELYTAHRPVIPEISLQFILEVHSKVKNFKGLERIEALELLFQTVNTYKYALELQDKDRKAVKYLVLFLCYVTGIFSLGGFVMYWCLK